MRSPAKKRVASALIAAVLTLSLGLIGYAVLRPGSGSVAPSPAPGTIAATGAPRPSPSVAPGPSSPQEAIRTPQPCSVSEMSAPANPDFAESVQTIAKDEGVRVQVAWVSDGRILTTGTLTDVPAWSTAKVPIAIAAVRRDARMADSPSLSAAIRQSDNSAADTLWRALGRDDAARARAATAIIRESGDEQTTVPDHALRPPYTVFGQTPWSARAQVQFATALPCLPGSTPVIAHMKSIAPDQSWGMGALPEAAFKGGWGPAGAGDGYLVRQFGWYAGPGGARVPLAIVVQGTSFEHGVTAVSRIATAANR